MDKFYYKPSEKVRESNAYLVTQEKKEISIVDIYLFWMQIKPIHGMIKIHQNHENTTSSNFAKSSRLCDCTILISTCTIVDRLGSFDDFSVTS